MTTITEQLGLTLESTRNLSDMQNNVSDIPSIQVGIDHTVQAIGITIGITDIFLGTIGNLMTIIAILGNKQLQNTFHIFIVSLCFVDLLTACAMMPFNVTSYILKDWAFGRNSFSCSFQAFSYYCCGYTSIVCLLVITVNRYIGIIHSEYYDDIFTRARCYVIVFISWIFAPVVMGPVFYLGNNELPGYGWVDKYSLCVFRTDLGNKSLIPYMNFIRILFQAVPLIIMVTLYAIIFYKVHKTGRDVIRMSIRSDQSCETGSRRKSTFVSQMIRRRRSSDRRLLQISVTICIVFMVLFLPSVIVNLLPGSTFINPRVHMCASIITWLNSCVNPLVYYFMNPKLRLQYKRMVCSFAHTILPSCVKFRSEEWVNSEFRSSSRRSTNAL